MKIKIVFIISFIIVFISYKKYIPIKKNNKIIYKLIKADAG